MAPKITLNPNPLYPWIQKSSFNNLHILIPDLTRESPLQPICQGVANLCFTTSDDEEPTSFSPEPTPSKDSSFNRGRQKVTMETPPIGPGSLIPPPFGSSSVCEGDSRFPPRALASPGDKPCPRASLPVPCAGDLPQAALHPL